jgi:hypothetical protein
MTKADKRADEIAQLKSEVEALKAAQPKPQKSFAELEREAREWMSQMHELREGRMRYAIHPSVVRDMAGGVTDADCADLRRVSHRPIGPSPMSPSSPPVTAGGRPANVAGSGTGWAREIPLGPSPHQRYVDAQLDAQDLKDRRELIEQKAQEQALLKSAEQIEALHDKLQAGQPKAKGKS